MKIFKYKPVTFIVVEFYDYENNKSTVLDYPKNLRIPQKDEVLFFNNYYGFVEHIETSIYQDIYNIKIKVSNKDFTEKIGSINEKV